MLTRLACACVLALAVVQPARAEIASFEFQGAVIDFVGGTTFQRSIAPSTSVTGAFHVDFDSSVTHEFASNRKGYLQEIDGGLTISFGSGAAETTVSASEYLVVVVDDEYDVVFQQNYDQVELLFATDVDPDLATPLRVNGVAITSDDFNRDGAVDGSDYQMWRDAYGADSGSSADGNGDGVVNATDYVVWRDRPGAPVGLLSIQFRSFADPFTGADLHTVDLPITLAPGSFVSMFNRINDDIGNQTGDVFFNLTTWQSIEAGVSAAPLAAPAPSATALLGASLAFGFAVAPRRRGPIGG